MVISYALIYGTAASAGTRRRFYYNINGNHNALNVISKHQRALDGHSFMRRVVLVGLIVPVRERIYVILCTIKAVQLSLGSNSTKPVSIIIPV